MKRTGLTIAGVLLLLTGTVWFFQGIGVIPGSFMTGQDFWTAAGIIAVIGGVFTLRSSRRKPVASEPMVSPEVELESEEAIAEG